MLQKNPNKLFGQPSIKIDSKWVKNLNISKTWSWNILEENTREKFLDIGLGNYCFGYDPENKATKANTDKGLHQTKKLLHSKGTIDKAKWQPIKWKKVFLNYAFKKGLIAKIYEELNSVARK